MLPRRGVQSPSTVGVTPGSPVALIASKRVTSGCAATRVVDRQRRARLLDVEAVQEMDAVDDQQRIHRRRASSARSGGS